MTLAESGMDPSGFLLDTTAQLYGMQAANATLTTMQRLSPGGIRRLGNPPLVLQPAAAPVPTLVAGSQGSPVPLPLASAWPGLLEFGQSFAGAIDANGDLGSDCLRNLLINRGCAL